MNDLVLDASAAIALGHGENLDAPTRYFASELIDLEFLHAIRRLVRLGALSDENATTAVESWALNDVVRCSHTPNLPRVWELRHNITPYDASYVALAEELRLPLLTADRRLAAAAERYCEVILVD